jgi:hypothetical protein
MTRLPTRVASWVVLFLCCVSPSGRPSAQGSPVPAARASTARVEIRLTRVHLIDVGHGVPLRVPRMVDVTGSIDGQPYGSEIRVAVACGDGQFRLVDGAAFTFVNGDWRLPTASLVPASVSGVSRCDVVAFVADPIRDSRLDRGALYAMAYGVSNVVAVEVDARVPVHPGPELTIDVVAGQPAGVGGRLVVPWVFDVRGTWRHLDAAYALWPMVTCDQASTWRALAGIVRQPDGSWELPRLTLPGVQPGSHCSLMIVASRERPRGAAYSTDELSGWLPVRSTIRHLVQRPAFMSIQSLTERSGSVHVVDDVMRSRSDGVAILSSELSAVAVAGDTAPPLVHVSICVQRPGSTDFLMFGPASAQGPGQWASTNVRLVMSDARSVDRAICVVMSREPLHGRAMSASDIDAVALGFSAIVRVRAPTSRRCRPITARITRINGEEPADAAVLDSSLLNLEGDVIHKCDGHNAFIGLGDGTSRRWRLYPVQPDADGHWSTSVTVPVAVAGEPHPVRQLGLVLASEAVGQGLYDEAWLGAYAALLQPMPFVVPLQSAPWTATLGAWTARLTGVHGKETDMALMQWVWMLLWPWVVVALAVAATRAAFRRVPRLQAWFNGWRDANRIDRRTVRTTRYEERLQAKRDEERARRLSRMTPRIAALRISIAEDTRVRSALVARLKSLVKSSGVSGVQRGMSKWAHHSAFATTTLGESAFNMAAFRALQEADLFTLFMSLSVCVTLPVAATYIGVTLKRWQTRSDHAPVLVSVTALVIVGALWAINEIRVAHLNAIDPAFLKANPALNLAFIPVNLLVVFATSLLAFMRHDSVEGFTELDSTRRKVERKRSKKQRKLARITAALKAALQTIDARYAGLKAVYLGAYERYRRHEGSVANAAPVPRHADTVRAAGQKRPAAARRPQASLVVSHHLETPTASVDRPSSGNGTGV